MSKLFCCHRDFPTRRASATALVWLLGTACLPSAVFDFSSQLQSVTVNQSGSQITYSVFDPARGTTVPGSDVSTSFFNLRNVNGVITWSDGTRVYYRIYDTQSGEWRKQEVTASANNDLRTSHGVVAFSTPGVVTMAAYDHSRQAWRGINIPTRANPNDLETSHGMVTWTDFAQSITRVYYQVYNPVTGTWVGNAVNYGGGVSVQDLQTRDGVAAWSTGRFIHGATFDPRGAGWVTFDADAGSGTFDLTSADQTVSWSSSGRVFSYLYDPSRTTWQGASFGPWANVTQLTTTASTVSWNGSGTAFSVGYNIANATWNLTRTPAYAAFGVSTNSGNAPLGVHFFDLSIGSGSWSWNFGDGTSSGMRSPYHRYENFSSNTVSLATTSPAGGSSSDARGLRTDVTPPTGAVLINNGAALATNTTVQLALTVQDNSGAVAFMRFSNDRLTWSPWEPWAATRTWIVAQAVGTNTVFAQFQDVAMNVSAIVSDTIEVDTTPPPFIQFSMANYFLLENTNVFPVNLRLSHAYRQPVSVRVFSTESTALNGADFVPVNETLVFSPNTTNAAVNLTLINDETTELNEAFFLSMDQPVNGVAGAPATITILDDDLPSLSFTTNRFSVREDVPEGHAVITVRLSAATGREVSVEYATSPGTAVAPDDYATAEGLLQFAPGETMQSFNVPIVQDAEDESTETVQLSLRNPFGAPLGNQASSVLEIVDDDAPSVTFVSTNATVLESAPDGARLEVRLTSPFEQLVSVNYSLSSITASAGSDYFNFPGTLTFLPGQTNQQIPVNLINDLVPENNEALRVSLTQFSNVDPGPIVEMILTIVDDDRPRFLSTRRNENGQFEADIAVLPGLAMQVQSTTNFVQWAVVTNILNTPTNVLFIDPLSPVLPRRVYRAVVPQ